MLGQKNLRIPDRGGVERVTDHPRPDGADRSHGSGNLARWNAQGHKFPEIEAAVAKFRGDLEAALGSAPTPAHTALAASCVASYTGILLIQNRLLAARGRYSRIESLLALLPTLVGSLQRTTRQLAGDAEPPELPAGAALEEWARQRRERLQATNGGDSGPSEVSS